MKTTVKIENGVEYLGLSDKFQTLPKNCLFDKGKVGCGGTTIALTSNENYIICVPFVSLIQNKTGQPDKYPNVLGVHKDVTATEIKDYLAKDGIKKIMVTYDSLARICKYINPLDYSLLIDEYHLLFTQYSFRREAAQTVLTNYTRFKDFTFMTATVVDDDFLLEELKGLDLVVAEWETVREVTVKSVRCENNPVDATVYSIVNRLITDEIKGNGYFFVNSVEFIKDVIEACGLTEANCRVIYSKNNKTQVGITNGSTTDEPKKINLLTSTVFEGTDIYDKEGKIYIISDSRKPHTLTDISTSFQQIAGRIRNTKYWNTITHIFTTTRYSNNLSYSEFKDAAIKQIDSANLLASEFNGLSKMAKDAIKTIAVESYVVKYDNIFSFDPNLVKIDLYNFKICKSLYKLRVNVVNELKNNGFNVELYNSKLATDVVRLDSKAKTFKETIEEIEHLNPDDELYMAALLKYSFLDEAIKELGFEGIKEADYVVTNIKRILINSLKVNDATKVMKLLKLTNEFGNGLFISADRAKFLIQVNQESIGVSKTAKIKDYFEVKLSSKWYNNKANAGYIIIMPKIVL